MEGMQRYRGGIRFFKTLFPFRNCIRLLIGDILAVVKSGETILEEINKRILSEYLTFVLRAILVYKCLVLTQSLTKAS